MGAVLQDGALYTSYSWPWDVVEQDAVVRLDLLPLRHAPCAMVEHHILQRKLGLRWVVLSVARSAVVELPSFLLASIPGLPPSQRRLEPC